MQSLIKKVPNQFPEYQESDTSNELVSGQLKTVFFNVLCAIAIIILTVYYAAIPGPVEVTVNEPSYSDYLSFESKSPQCPCGGASRVLYSSIASINLQTDPFCPAVKAADAQCESTLQIIFGLTNYPVGNPAAGECAARSAEMKMGSSLCQVADDLVAVEIAGFNAATLSSSFLLDRATTVGAVTVDGENRLQSVRVALAGTVKAIQAIFNIERPVRWGGTSNTPGLSENSQRGYSTIRPNTVPASNFVMSGFPFDFNTVPSPLWLNCMASYPVYKDSNGNVLGHCTEFSSYTSFLANDTIDAYIQQWGQINDPIWMSAASNMSASRFKTSKILMSEVIFKAFIQDPGVTTTVDYTRYYNECAPRECVYIDNRRRSATEVVVVLFGLIGGVTTVATFLVATLLPFIAAKIYGENETKKAADMEMASGDGGATSTN